MKLETKIFGGNILEAKQETRNGILVGIIKGYIATWDLDRCNDRFVKGCFEESLKNHRKKNRQIRFKDQHGRTVGGYPIETVKEDNKGLFGIAEVNLEVQQGRELFALAKQRVIVDKSIGFTSQIDQINEDGHRIISKAIVWEGSAVDEPMNEEANIVEVKKYWSDDGNETKGNSLGAFLRRSIRGLAEDDEERLELIEQISSRAGIQVDTVGEILRGRIICPPLNRLEAFASVLKISIDSIISAAESDGCEYNDKGLIGCAIQTKIIDKESLKYEDLKDLSDRELEDKLEAGVSFSRKNAKVIIATLKTAGLRDADDGTLRDADYWSQIISELKKTQQLLEGVSNDA